MERRTFLGAAAAVAALSTSAGSAADRAEVSTDTDLGTSMARFPSRGEVWSDVEFKQHGLDEAAELRVAGSWLDDEPGHVDVHFSNRFAHLTISVGPDEAREVARDLLEAAEHAESGPSGRGVEGGHGD